MKSFIKFLVLAFCLALPFEAQSAEPPASMGPVTLTAANQTVISQAYREAFLVDARSITGTVAINVAGSVDDGQTWTKLKVKDVSNCSESLTITANGAYTGSAAGFSRLRVIATTLTAGQGVARIVLNWASGTNNNCGASGSDSAAQLSAMQTMVVQLQGVAGSLTYVAAVSAALTASTTPQAFNNAADAFAYAIDTTVTGAARIVRPAQCKNTISASLMMAATTYTSSAMTTGYLFMTPSAATTFMISNPSSNTQTAYVYPSFSATANYSATPITLTPGSTLNFPAGQAPTYVHAAWALGLQSASGLVFYGCYGNAYTGTTYGFLGDLWKRFKGRLESFVTAALDIMATEAQAMEVGFVGPNSVLEWISSSSVTLANNTNEQTVYEFTAARNVLLTSFRVDLTAATTLTGIQFRIYTKRGAGSYVLLSDLEHPTGINLWLLAGIDGYECLWKNVGVPLGDSFKITAQQTVASASFAVPFDVTALR